MTHHPEYEPQPVPVTRPITGTESRTATDGEFTASATRAMGKHHSSLEKLAEPSAAQHADAQGGTPATSTLEGFSGTLRDGTTFHGGTTTHCGALKIEQLPEQLRTDAVKLRKPGSHDFAQESIAHAEMTETCLPEVQGVLASLRAELAELQEENDTKARIIESLETEADAACRQLIALKDWRGSVTVALQRPGGTHYEDVSRHIQELVKGLDAALQELAELKRRYEIIDNARLQVGKRLAERALLAERDAARDTLVALQQQLRDLVDGAISARIVAYNRDRKGAGYNPSFVKASNVAALLPAAEGAQPS